MRAAGYGRIVNTTSDAIFAYPQVAVYGAAKAGVNGLTANLAFEGGRYGIKVNAVSPSATTIKHPEMAGVDDSESYLKGKEHQVEQVASVVAYLSHRMCKPNGAVFYAGRGTVREYRTYASAGCHDPDITIESVAANINRIQDQTWATEHSTGLSADDIEATPRRAYKPE
jgi:NAD(P)-dependent dehydrogenase (short-subunit alcohol dehydrogenase family)